MLNNSDIINTNNTNKYNMNNNNSKRDDKTNNNNKFEFRRTTNRIRAKENNNNNLIENNIMNNSYTNRPTSFFNMPNNLYASPPQNRYNNYNSNNNIENKIEIECVCNYNNYVKNGMIQCLLCGKYQHTDCIFKAKDILPYICFNCQFKNNHFYLKWKKTILSAQEIIYKKEWEDNKKRLVEGTRTFEFYLNSRELNSLYNNDSNNSHYIVFLWLTNNGRPFQLGFPDNIKIEINNRKFYFTESKGFKRPLLLAIDNTPLYSPKKRSLITSEKFEIPNINDYFISPKNPFNKEKYIQKVTISFEDLLENYHGSEFEYEAKRHYLFYVGLFQEIKIPSLKNYNDLKQYHEAFKNLYNEKVVKLKWNKVSNFVSLGNVGEDEMNMNLISNVSNQKIIHPVRGLFCQHSDVLDYGECCGYITSNSQVYKCFKCYKPLNIMYIDDMSEKMFNKYKNDNYTRIYYTNKFKFIRGENIDDTKKKEEKKNDNDRDNVNDKDNINGKDIKDNIEEEDDSLSQQFFDFYSDNKFKENNNDYDNDEINNDNNTNQIIELNSSSESIDELMNNNTNSNEINNDTNRNNSDNNYMENDSENPDKDFSLGSNSNANQYNENNQRKEPKDNNSQLNYRNNNFNNENVPSNHNNTDGIEKGEIIVLDDDEDEDMEQNQREKEKENNNLRNRSNSKNRYNNSNNNNNNNNNINQNKINRNKILRDNTINNRKNNNKEKERQNIFDIYRPPVNNNEINNKIFFQKVNENNYLGKKRKEIEMEEKDNKNMPGEQSGEITSEKIIQKKKKSQKANTARKTNNKRKYFLNSDLNENKNYLPNNIINSNNGNITHNFRNNNNEVAKENLSNTFYSYSCYNNNISSEDMSNFCEDKKIGSTSELPSSSISYISNNNSNSYKKSTNKKRKNKNNEKNNGKNAKNGLSLDDENDEENWSNSYLFGKGREEDSPQNNNKNGYDKNNRENKKGKKNNKNNNKMDLLDCDTLKLKNSDYIEVRPYDDFKKLTNEKEKYLEENNDDVYLNDIKVFELKHRQNDFINFDYFTIQRKLREFCAAKEQNDEIFEANKKLYNPRI